MRSEPQGGISKVTRARAAITASASSPATAPWPGLAFNQRTTIAATIDRKICAVCRVDAEDAEGVQKICMLEARQDGKIEGGNLTRITDAPTTGLVEGGWRLSSVGAHQGSVTGMEEDVA